MQRCSVVAALAGVVFLAQACSLSTPSRITHTDKLPVVVTFNALKELTQMVGGEKIHLVSIVPDGVDSHDFEPKAKHMAFISDAKVIVYNGLGMEPWIHSVLHAARNSGSIRVEAAQGIVPLKAHTRGHTAHHVHAHASHGSAYDPHVWLSVCNAQTMLRTIGKALCKADPQHTRFYKRNARNAAARLEALYKEYRSKFAALSHRYFVTTHAAFGYLCRDFDLQQKSIKDVFNTEEPSIKRLVELVEFSKKHSVRTIFSERGPSEKVARVLAQEIGASVETIYTMEKNEENLSYYERMKHNINRIYRACSKQVTPSQ
ncbi:metal ABC transporter substrate-binding protein [Treponema pallidum]|uniref:Putative metal-binding protein TP_0034 n=4 Tax=Treponema pallidum TaxID=160 RepID=Y034_TREPA|nr:metal ABC transporter substrate-binding protein [Treponema pallidum]O83077.1 RecName: Full=Putative metal-binding protein TP_0034; Flags: Precursor [Treponema pallidum subsp. pallidum str. Nichols]AAC65029.1 ABC transporter, periplasmic binding protein [Treponema pallidum subsp. pallidum str. Nichols]ACD70461.1 ABC transporter, periplasmic binding protein [Treponema pallidum subsp. pallidum SS14]AFU66067.1 zinc (Zn2+) ABC superfamily ATP binding cassette transporter, binding protein [Trepone